MRTQIQGRIFPGEDKLPSERRHPRTLEQVQANQGSTASDYGNYIGQSMYGVINNAIEPMGEMTNSDPYGQKFIQDKFKVADLFKNSTRRRVLL